MFTPVLGVNLNSVVTSDPLLLDINTKISVTNGTLLINGNIVSSPYNAAIGDSVQLRTISSTYAETPSFVPVIIGNTFFVWFCLTEAVKKYKIRPVYLDQIAFEYYKDIADNVFVPDNTNNGLYIYDIQGNLISSVHFNDDVTSNNTDSDRNSVILIEPRTGDLLKIDTVSKGIENKLSLGSKIGAGCNLPNAQGKNDICVTLPATNQVYLLTYDLQIINSITIDGTPIGVARYNDKVIVCCKDGNEIAITDFTTTHYIEINGSPYSVIVSGDKAYVSCVDQTHIFILNLISFDGTYVETDELTNGELLQDDDNIYCCAQNYIYKINKNTLALSIFNDSSALFTSGTLLDGVLYVTDISGSKIHKISTALEKLTEFQVQATPYSITNFDGKIAVCSLYQNSPNPIANIDRSPGAFEFSSPIEVPRNYTITSTEAVVQSIEQNETVLVWVPQVLSATIYINDIAVPSATNVELDDIVQISIISPEESTTTFGIPLIIGDKYSYFGSTTYDVDSTPDSFEFVPVLNVVPLSVQTSNPVTITGIDPDAIVVVTVNKGVVLKNGIDKGNFSEFSLNDILNIRVAASDKRCEVIHVVINAGNYTTVWSVATEQNYLGEFTNGTKLWELPTVPANSIIDSSRFLTHLQNEFSTITDVDLNQVGTGFVDNGSLIIIDPVTKEILSLDTLSMQVEGSILTTGTPVAYAYFPLISESIVATVSLVITSSPNALLVLDNNLQILASIPLANTPLDLVSVDVDRVIISYDTEVIEYQLTESYYLIQLNTVQAPKARIFSFERLVFISYNGKTDVHYPFTNIIKTIERGAIDISFSETGFAIADDWNNQVAIYLYSFQQLSSITFDEPPIAVARTNTSTYAALPLSGRIVRIDTGVITNQVILDDTIIDMVAHGTSMLVARMWSNLNLEEFAIPLTDLDAVILPITENAEPLSIQESASFTISGLLRHAILVIDTYPGSTIIVNGEDKGVVAKVFNGDEVKFLSNAPAGYYTLRNINFGTCRGFYQFKIRTIGNRLPNVVFFNTKYDTLVSTIEESNVVVIDGLTPGFTSVIDITSTTSEIFVLLVNDVEIEGSTATVTNGDQLKFVVKVSPMYGEPNFYELSYNGQVFGSFKIVSLILDGPIIWPIFGVNNGQNGVMKSSAVSNLIQQNLEGIIFSEEIRKLNATESSISNYNVILADYLYAPVRIIPNNTFITNQLGYSIFNFLIKTPIDSNDWTKESYSIKDSELQVFTRSLFTTLGINLPQWIELNYSMITNAHIVIYEPVLIRYHPYINELSSFFINKDNFSMYEVEANNAFINESIVREISLVFPLVYNYSLLLANLEYFTFKYNIVDVQVVYNIVRYDTKIEIDTRFLELNTNLHDTSIDGFLRTGSYSYTLNVYNFEISNDNFYLYNSLLPDIDYSSIRTIFASDCSISETNLYTVETNGFSNVTPNYIIGIKKDGQIFCSNKSDVELPTSTIQKAGILTSYGRPWLANQDMVTVVPQYDTCEEAGLFSNAQDSYNNALYLTNAVRPITVVQFKNCFLWTINTAIDSITCASIGPDDTYIIPISWHLSQGPLRILKTLTKNERWKHGG